MLFGIFSAEGANNCSKVSSEKRRRNQKKNSVKKKYWKKQRSYQELKQNLRGTQEKNSVNKSATNQKIPSLPVPLAWKQGQN